MLLFTGWRHAGAHRCATRNSKLLPRQRATHWLLLFIPLTKPAPEPDLWQTEQVTSKKHCLVKSSLARILTQQYNSKWARTYALLPGSFAGTTPSTYNKEISIRLQKGGKKQQKLHKKKTNNRNFTKMKCFTDLDNCSTMPFQYNSPGLKLQSTPMILFFFFFN